MGHKGLAGLYLFLSDKVGKKAAEGIVEIKIKATGDSIEVHADSLIETLDILTKDN
ncbi:hypothetical protein [Streptococcus equi]|uniref:hypothetical protein n=1 Tax=Streptococcus equi TaxID=1336 RepID=UPI001E56B78D|nr:hypothetical protein [Streptococcus equi]MCD3461270.1 hypothetical protein [Streptococcus equi subsp. zooepidemicus]